MGLLNVSLWSVRQGWDAGPGRLALTVLLGVAVAAVPALQVVLMAQFVSALPSAEKFRDLAIPFVGLVLMIALVRPVQDIAGILRWRSVDLIELHAKQQVAETVASLPPRDIAKPNIAAKIESGNKAAENDIAALYPFVLAVCQSSLSVVGLVVTLMAMSPVAALFVLASLAPMLYASQRVAQINRRLWGRIAPLYQRSRYLHQQLVGPASSIELSSLGANSQISTMVARTVHKVSEYKAQTYPAELGWRLASGFATSALLAGALAALIVGVDYGPEAAGGMYGVMAAMGAVGTLGANLGYIVEGTAPFERYVNVLKLREGDVPPSVASEAKSLQVMNLSHAYEGADRNAVQNLTLDLRKGDMVAFVGVNGAGKTTAVNAITGMLEVQSGSVCIDAHDQASTGPQEWVGYFGVLAQEYGRYELTVRESLGLGVPHMRVTDQMMWNALEAARVAETVRGFRDGLDQQLGSQWDGGVGLSGGQWQRLALARLYLRNAPIWVLDEPTSSIDAEAEQEIFDLLSRTKAGRVTVIVSHRAWTLRTMDEILVFEDGCVVERGTYGDLLRRKGRFAEIFAEQTA